VIGFAAEHVPLKKGADSMGQRVVRFSDLTNTIIADDDDVVRVVIEQHPALENGPVELEISDDEAEAIQEGALSVVSLKLYKGDESAPAPVIMEIEAFNKLAGDRDMADVIRQAEPAYPPRRQAKPAAAPNTEKLDYATLEHAGKPHRGKTTDAEKEIVRTISTKSTNGLYGTDCAPSDWMTPRWPRGMGLKSSRKKWVPSAVSSAETLSENRFSTVVFVAASQ
jgi:hypothetical protein